MDSAMLERGIPDWPVLLLPEKGKWRRSEVANAPERENTPAYGPVERSVSLYGTLPSGHLLQIAVMLAPTQLLGTRHPWKEASPVIWFP
jgi:hypothetical protein